MIIPLLDKRKQQLKEAAARHKEKHPEAWKLAKTKYKENHPDRVKEQAKKSNDSYRKHNAELLKQKNKEWRMANLDYILHKNVERRARSKQATPNWDLELTRFVFMEAKTLARLREKETGFSWHVDHIIPLRGELVSGLHVWNNFQVIPAKENMSKHNRSDISS